MRIAGAASAFPRHYYSQEMLLAALQDYWGDKIENPHVLRRLHRHVRVDGRYLSLPKEEYLKMKTWGEANHHWIRTAQELGEKALAGALADAGLHGRNLGAFFFVSAAGRRSSAPGTRQRNVRHSRARSPQQSRGAARRTRSACASARPLATRPSVAWVGRARSGGCRLDAYSSGVQCTNAHRLGAQVHVRCVSNQPPSTLSLPLPASAWCASMPQ